ncbi:MAG: siderophore ABC transporter substrate-binding protein [Propioniciclava sp.]
MLTQRRAGVLTAMTAVALALAGCSGSAAGPVSPTSSADVSTVTVTDNWGKQTVTVPPSSVVATDNRTFETLDAWGVKLAAAPIALVPSSLSYATDESIIVLGPHVEPDLEAIVATEPDLVIVGQRFAQHYDSIKGLVPDATLLNIDPRDTETYESELKRQTEVLGQVFGHEAEAATIIDEFDAAIARVKAAYDPEETVLAVVTSGGAINYAAPHSGRSLGPVFTMVGLTPAIEATGTTDHEGDEIAVEAVADSNPDWILVLDRDAGLAEGDTVDGEPYTPANELIADSAALQNVTAVTEGQVVHMPADTYLNEGIQTYTEFLNQMADAMEAQS